MAIFGHSKFVPVFLGKIVGKILEQPILAIPNLYQSFSEKFLKKIGMATFGHSEFIPVFLGKLLEKMAVLNFFWQFFCIYNFIRV